MQNSKIEKRAHISEPVWHTFIVESKLPKVLSPLKDIAKNMWWVWNKSAHELFNYIDPAIWEKGQNPIELLEKVSLDRLETLANNDSHFIHMMTRVEADLNTYIQQRENPVGPKIAYFSMEYGIHTSLKIYSGGLGILAGDYLKEASDSNSNMKAVGLFYRYGYFQQSLSAQGDQIAEYEAELFDKSVAQRVLNSDGTQLEFGIDFPGREVKVQVWKVDVGTIELFLLDTDFEANSDSDRTITHHLYGGDNENRIKQEIVLGIGGIKALNALEVDADIYHCNEGHAAFISLERIKNKVQNEKMPYLLAKELISASTLFTTHTPVPAGHDAFHFDLFRYYMGGYAEAMGIDTNTFEMLGKAKDWEEEFNMSYLASHLSQEINGVSKLHGDVSKDLLNTLYEGYLPEEIKKIGYVTNGIHYPTWTSHEWQEQHAIMLDRSKPISILDYNEEEECNYWKNVYKSKDDNIWNLKQSLKAKMFIYLEQRLKDNSIQKNEDPKYISEVLRKLDNKALTIGFARRFATYKRAHLLFRNLDRLNKIINNPSRPVQFLFAGKAHPADKAGQDLIKYIKDIAKRPEFVGKILFIQNYDISVAQKMIQGVDIWMNTPTRPLEASGTSGEKGIMNGTLHFSVLDGWWCEGYKPDAGWALPEKRTYENQDLQDDLDSETIYNIFENEIVPAYYYRDTNNVPHRWVSFMKNNFAEVAPKFTMTRMLKDYYDRFYLPIAERGNKLKADNNSIAKEIADWKFNVAEVWNDIEVVDMSFVGDGTFNLGAKYPVNINLNLKGLKKEDIGVELVITTTDTKPTIVAIKQFEAKDNKDGSTSYTLTLEPRESGTYNLGVRMYPSNENLPNRQDFERVKWL